MRVSFKGEVNVLLFVKWSSCFGMVFITITIIFFPKWLHS